MIRVIKVLGILGLLALVIWLAGATYPAGGFLVLLVLVALAATFSPDK